MVIFGRLPTRMFFFWLVQFGVISVIWGFLPSQAAAVFITALVLLSSVFLFTKNLALPTLLNIGCIVAITQFWLSNGFISPVVGTALVLIGVTLTGLLAEALQDETADGLSFPIWLLIGFITSQLSSIIAFFPMGFLQKTILGLTFFYLFWQYFRLIELQRQQGIIAHFIFVSLAVIVVLGSIIWIELPQLRIF